MPKVLQLKITLYDLKPQIWRRFLIEENTSFHRLHRAIQEVMGWEHYHLYEFSVGETRISKPGDDWPDGSLDSRKIRLKGMLQEKQKFSYLYDFGDDWIHELKAEKIEEKSDYTGPICIAGERACPPEDCGGTPGYERLLSILKDKSHEEHEEMLEWAGGKFDAKHFDLETVNKRLKQL